MTINELEKIYRELKPEQINLKSFDAKETLNPKIWDTKGMKLIVRERLLQIAAKFIDTLCLENPVPEDIVVVGSIAGFNWSSYSDIDLHIVFDFDKIGVSKDMLTNYFEALKNDWNNKHSNLSIYGYEVELYAQDVNDDNVSDGIYSIVKDRWIKIPTAKNIHINKSLVCNQAAKLINQAEEFRYQVENCNDREQLKVIKDELHDFYKEITNGRRESLASDGEEGSGNIVFKVLRRTGHLGMLRDLKSIIFDKINSL